MAKLKAKDIRVSISLLAVLIFASVGLYTLNRYQPSADTLPTASSSSSSAASSGITDSSPFPDDTTDIGVSSDNNADNFSSLPSEQPTAPAEQTATSGTVSPDQSSALLDKQCISADGTDVATIDVIIRDIDGNILVGDSYKPQINVDPTSGLSGNIVAGTSNDWLIQLKSTAANQVTAKVGSQNVLITTLTLNFATDCPTSAVTTTGTNSDTSSLVDTTGSESNTANSAQNITKASTSKINPIYYIGAGLVALALLVGGALIFLKRRMNSSQLPQDEEIIEEPIANSQPPTPPTNPPVPPTTS